MFSKSRGAVSRILGIQVDATPRSGDLDEHSTGHTFSGFAANARLESAEEHHRDHKNERASANLLAYSQTHVAEPDVTDVTPSWETNSPDSDMASSVDSALSAVTRRRTS